MGWKKSLAESLACKAIHTDLLKALKGERISSVFSPDGTLISASAALHCGVVSDAILMSNILSGRAAVHQVGTITRLICSYREQSQGSLPGQCWQLAEKHIKFVFLSYGGIHMEFGKSVFSSGNVR